MANYNYLTDTGVIIPDTSDIKAGIEDEFRAALGQNIPVTSDTAQGALISAETSARVSVVQNNAQLANQINPDTAGGVFLDGLLALLGGSREPATRTVIPAVTMSGRPLTPIPQYSQARTTGGDIFRTVTGCQLDATGTCVVDFESVDTGPVPAPLGALNTVVDMVLGWEAVNNAAAGALGRAQQSDTSARAMRRVTLARQGISVSEAITSDLYALPGVNSLVFRENYTKVDATIDGIFLLANSVYVCIDGGKDADIAAALLTNKTIGGNWNGTTTKSVVDQFSGQTYPVKFSRPTKIGIRINITVSRGTDLSDPLTSVPAAIVNGCAGLIPGEEGLTVGHNASPFEFGSYVNYYHPGMRVTKVEIFKISGGSPAPVEIAIALSEQAFTALAYVSVTVA